MLRRGPGPISVRVGEQTMDASTVPAFVSQSYGIANDQKDVLEVLDEIAPVIALEEENLEVEAYGSGDEEDGFADFVHDEEGEDE